MNWIYLVISLDGRRIVIDVMNMMKKILMLSCVLLISILILVPGVIAADPTGIAAVSGNPALIIGLTVTGANPFGDLNPGPNVNTTSNSVKALVVTNAPWAISVSDELTTSKPVGSVGKMAEWDGSAYTSGGKVLTDAFQVSKDGSAWVTLSGVQQLLCTGIAGTTEKFPYFQQTIETADTRVGSGHSYRTVVTFTLTPT